MYAFVVLINIFYSFIYINMKKLLSLVVLLFGVTFFAACSNTSTIPDDTITSGAIETGNIETGTLANCLPTTAPWIKVISPNGWESYEAGQQITVTWESCNVDQSVGITLSGFPYPNDIQFFLGNWVNSADSTETLTIPATATTGNYIFNVSTPPESSSGAEDWSDTSFTIQ